MKLVLILLVACLLRQAVCSRISNGCFSLMKPCISQDLCRNGLLKNACDSEDSSCQMQSPDSCNVTIQAILAHSLLSKDCMCSEEDACGTLQLLAAFCNSYLDDEPLTAPEKSSVETQQENNQTSVPDPQISCLQEITLCLQDELCNRQLVPFVQSCAAPKCEERLCRLVTRSFYYGLPENVAEKLVFCQCERDDQDCLHFQAMLNSSSCKRDQTHPWNCLEMLDNCSGEMLCRKAFESFVSKCFGPADTSYNEYSTTDLLLVIDLDFLLSEDKECRMAIVATMGYVLQSPCTCHGLDHHDLYRCNMLQKAIQDRSYYTHPGLKQVETTQSTQMEVNKSEQHHSWFNDPLWYFVACVVVAMVILIAVAIVLCKRRQRHSMSGKGDTRRSCQKDVTKSLVL